MNGLPRVEIVEESPREGMQIESRSIPTAVKTELIDRLSSTGLRTIVVGAFVSPRWVPQMTDVGDVIAAITPVDGVRYRALAFNERGRQRRAELTPPLSDGPDVERFTTRVHLCDVFVRRNLNIRQADEIAGWPRRVAAAVDRGAREAGIGLNAAWGSNFVGEFGSDERTDLLRRQYEMWRAAGVPVHRVWLGDPMGWNAPHQVAEQIAIIRREFPDIRSFHLHLHDTRGLALASAWAAVGALGPEHELLVDSSVGGIGGCPYCGNGRATGMIATEDLAAMLQRIGQQQHVDLDAVIETSTWLAGVVGRPLSGRVAHAGPFPSADRFYPVDLPLIETYEEAQHFRVGPRAYAQSRAPWKPGDAVYELTPRPTAAQRQRREVARRLTPANHGEDRPA
jgi:hydroxymethylglutaryl-CoA lyase